MSFAVSFDSNRAISREALQHLAQRHFTLLGGDAFMLGALLGKGLFVGLFTFFSLFLTRCLRESLPCFDQGRVAGDMSYDPLFLCQSHECFVDPLR